MARADALSGQPDYGPARWRVGGVAPLRAGLGHEPTDLLARPVPADGARRRLPSARLATQPSRLPHRRASGRAGGGHRHHLGRPSRPRAEPGDQRRLRRHGAPRRGRCRLQRLRARPLPAGGARGRDPAASARAAAGPAALAGPGVDLRRPLRDGRDLGPGRRLARGSSSRSARGRCGDHPECRLAAADSVPGRAARAEAGPAVAGRDRPDGMGAVRPHRPLRAAPAGAPPAGLHPRPAVPAQRDLPP